MTLDMAALAARDAAELATAGWQLRQERERLGLTRAEAAHWCGVSVATVQRIERGATSRSAVQRYSAALSAVGRGGMTL